MQHVSQDQPSASLSGEEVVCKQLVDEILINASVQFMFHAIYSHAVIFYFNRSDCPQKNNLTITHIKVRLQFIRRVFFPAYLNKRI